MESYSNQHQSNIKIQFLTFVYILILYIDEFWEVFVTFEGADDSIAHDVPQLGIACFSRYDEMLFAWWYLEMCYWSTWNRHATNLRRKGNWQPASQGHQL